MSDHETVTDGPAQIRIDGKLYDIPDDYTLREAMIFEEMSGRALEDSDLKSAAQLGAIVYIILRREDPTVTEDVLDGIRMSGLGGGEVEADAGPPVEGGAEELRAQETEATREPSGAPV
jgi:hypothetical protein